jgi:hypothetical protein
VTLRPKWSKLSDGTNAWQSYGCLFFAAALLASCSDLDPNIGQRRDRAEIADAAGPDGADPGMCPGVNPGEICFAVHIRPMIHRPSKGDPTGKGCKGCHYSTEPQHSGLDLGGLDLATLGALRNGGGSSARRIVVAGKPAESALVQVLRGSYPYAPQMPKNGPYWKPEEIDIVEQWIAQGAKGADGE